MRLPASVASAALVFCASAARPEQSGDMTTGSDSVGVELVLPRSVRAGEPVPIGLRVRNHTRHALDLYLRGRRPTFDVVISNAAGEVVWRRLEGEIVPAVLQVRTLEPGEGLDLEAVWDQRTRSGRPAEPGEYTARGALLAEGEPLETPAAPIGIVR